MLTQMLTIKAIQGAPVGVIAPFGYFEILGAVLISIFILGIGRTGKQA